MLFCEEYVSLGSDYYGYTPNTQTQKLFFYPVRVGHFLYKPGYFLKRTQYDSFLIMLVTSGTCTIIVSGKTFTACEGDVVLLDCYAPHQYGSSEGWEALWLHFDGPMARSYYEHITECSGIVLSPRDGKTVEHMLSKIYQIFRDGKHIIEASLSKYITIILTELILSDTKKEATPRIHQSLFDAVSYINKHFFESISLDSLSEQAALSPYHFTRIFKKQLGMTPHQYIVATRINAAKFLLKTTQLSVKEICFRTGFNSESSFCIAFKKHELLTPSQYRETNL